MDQLVKIKFTRSTDLPLRDRHGKALAPWRVDRPRRTTRSEITRAYAGEIYGFEPEQAAAIVAAGLGEIVE